MDENTFYNRIIGDNEYIVYQPLLKKISKSTNSAILLSSIINKCSRSKNGGFFKFKIHCNHPEYKSGDSWCEELNFSMGEFDGALKNIGINKNNPNKEKVQNALVWYYTDGARRTWYEVNTEKLKKALAILFK